MAWNFHLKLMELLLREAQVEECKPLSKKFPGVFRIATGDEFQVVSGPVVFSG